MSLIKKEAKELARLNDSAEGIKKFRSLITNGKFSYVRSAFRNMKTVRRSGIVTILFQFCSSVRLDQLSRRQTPLQGRLLEMVQKVSTVCYTTQALTLGVKVLSTGEKLRSKISSHFTY